METDPSEVYILLKIDQINASNNNSGAGLDSILAGVDDKYALDVTLKIHEFKSQGVLDTEEHGGTSKYRLTGEWSGASEEVKHYVKHRKVPH